MDGKHRAKTRSLAVDASKEGANGDKLRGAFGLAELFISNFSEDAIQDLNVLLICWVFSNK